MYKQLAVFLLTLTAGVLHGQIYEYELDALRYSQYDISGTARGLGVGGAFSSVGADFGSISLNPAGLGLFRHSEVIVSPAFLTSQTETEYITNPQTTGEFNTSKANRFYLNNLGIVFSRVDSDNSKKFKGYNFALGYMRMNHFNNKFKFENQNGFSSLINSYTSSIEGLPSSSINFQNVYHEVVLAYNTGLIRELDTSGIYYTPVSLPVNQEGLWKESGATDMAFLSMAVNIDDKFFFGGSLNFPFVRYERVYDYLEEDNLNTSLFFESFHFNQEYSAEGNGFNADFGIIAKPFKFMRLGASIQTPNYFTFSETTVSTMTANFDTVIYEDDFIQTFDFQLRLPWRFKSGVSFFIKRSAFISFDYELVGHSSTKFDFGINYIEFTNDLNAAIDTNHRNTSTFRIGAEYTLKSFMFRAGYAQTLSPFAFEVNDRFDFSRRYFTTGIGYKHDNFSIDVAYVRSKQNEFHLPYYLESGVFPLSVNSVTKNNIVITGVYKFDNN